MVVKEGGEEERRNSQKSTRVACVVGAHAINSAINMTKRALTFHCWSLYVIRVQASTPSHTTRLYMRYGLVQWHVHAAVVRVLSQIV
jgi:hypothetical protein